VDFLNTNFSNEPLRSTNENSESMSMSIFISGISVGQNYYPISELYAIRIIRQKPTTLAAIAAFPRFLLANCSAGH
jgi:hypothetical protein